MSFFKNYYWPKTDNGIRKVSTAKVNFLVYFMCLQYEDSRFL